MQAVMNASQQGDEFVKEYLVSFQKVKTRAYKCACTKCMHMRIYMHTPTYVHAHVHIHTFDVFFFDFIHIPTSGSSFDSQSHRDRNLEGEGFSCVVEEGP